MAVVTKIEVSLSLNYPVREVADVISLILNAHPSRQLEILKQIDEEVGLTIANMERALEQGKKDSTDMEGSGLDTNENIS